MDVFLRMKMEMEERMGNEKPRKKMDAAGPKIISFAPSDLTNHVVVCI